jgi:hypothetical protein
MLDILNEIKTVFITFLEFIGSNEGPLTAKCAYLEIYGICMVLGYMKTSITLGNFKKIKKLCAAKRGIRSFGVMTT